MANVLPFSIFCQEMVNVRLKIAENKKGPLEMFG